MGKYLYRKAVLVTLLILLSATISLALDPINSGMLVAQAAGQKLAGDPDLRDQQPSDKHSENLNLSHQSAGETDEKTLDDMLLDDYETDLSDPAEDLADPLYYFNYAMYGVNDFLYFYMVKPVATGYKPSSPRWYEKGSVTFSTICCSPFVLLIISFRVRSRKPAER